MGEIIATQRIVEFCNCKNCNGKDYSIVDDPVEGLVIVCASCAIYIGNLVIPED